jgi:hypothetical protein
VVVVVVVVSSTSAALVSVGGEVVDEVVLVGVLLVEAGTGSVPVDSVVVDDVESVAAPSDVAQAVRTKMSATPANQ